MGIGKAYRLVVFDLDGTLVDTRVDIARALQQTLTEAGYPRPDMERVIASIGGGAKKAVQTLTGLSGDALDEQVAVFLKIYERLCSDNSAVYDGGEALLRRLKDKGAKLALVTMKAKIPTHRILQKHGLTMFDEVVTYDDVEKRKPDPDCLHRMLDKYKIAPRDALMIGDAATDVQFAHAAGADACAAQYGYGDAAALMMERPEYAISRLSELL